MPLRLSASSKLFNKILVPVRMVLVAGLPGDLRTVWRIDAQHDSEAEGFDAAPTAACPIENPQESEAERRQALVKIPLDSHWTNTIFAL